MPSKTSELVQSIVQLQEMRTRQEALKLQQDMAPFQQMIARATAMGQLQNVGQGMVDPSQLGQFAGQLAPPGLDPAVMQTMFAGTAPSTSTTQGAAVAAGRAGTGSDLDRRAAEQTLTGEVTTPGTKLRDDMAGKALGMLNNMSPADEHYMVQGFLQRQATGQDLTSAMLDKVFDKFDPETKKLALKVKQGLALSEAERAQLSLGFTNARIQDRSVTAQSAAEAARIQAGLQEYGMKYGADRLKSVNEIVMAKDKLQQTLINGSATLTPDGKEQTRTTINAYNNLLRLSAPEIFGPGGTAPLVDMTEGSTIGATGYTDAIAGVTRNKIR